MMNVEEVTFDSLIEANKNFKGMVDDLLLNPEEFLKDGKRWKLLLRLRDRLKDSNTTNAHVTKFNTFCAQNACDFGDLPSYKERPHFYWWNHLELVKNGQMKVEVNKAEVNYNGIGYSIE
ncbi:MAG: hypothetical protein M0R46_00375 [Candidatus Muirbacterium halophilum]|nr:hypothetical protein [Candidatus Muirbacterium halophilum]MCK9474348.1 hypothetical protein [Candidatus Muirbacterium halophilum]